MNIPVWSIIQQMASPSGYTMGSFAKVDQTVAMSSDSTSLNGVEVNDKRALHSCPLIHDPLFVLSDKGSSAQPSTLSLFCCYAIDKKIGFASAVWTDSRGENLDIDVFQIPLVAETKGIT